MNGFHFSDRGNAVNEDFACAGALGTFDWVRDRPDHDHRHAIGASKLRRELG